MIISQTPFRISFFGGATDYPTWYREHSGAVLSTTINKYCHISCRQLPPFFDHKHRIVYSKIENIKKLEEIEHPAVRATLQYFKIDRGIEIHHDGDLPARSGIGSSSAFTVGLVHAVAAFLGKYIDKKELAKTAIHIEQDILREAVGSQDQINSAYGGLNRIDFRADDSFDVQPVVISTAKKQLLQNHLMLFFTGLSRYAPEIAKSQIVNFANRKKELFAIREMVEESCSILHSQGADILEFGKLMNEAWRLKRSLAEEISNSLIDNLHEHAIRAGAIGGKLLGAGGGGFLLFFVPPEKQNNVRKSLEGFLHIPFEFESSGSRIVLYDSHY